MRSLADAAVIVTGGSRNLGFQIARTLAAGGAHVFITSRNAVAVEQAAAELSRDGSVRGVVADSTDPAAMRSLLEELLVTHRSVEALINNAGSYEEAAVLELDANAMTRAMESNLQSALTPSQVIGHQMVEQGHGAIVNVASVSGHGSDGPSAAYSAAKAGLIALSRALAVELGPYGVRCNSVSPAYIDMRGADNADSDRKRWLRSDFRRAPLRRIATATEVAAACAFLASPDASGISGIDVKVDCGQSAYLFVEASYDPGDRQ